ncbi:hypothetical protein Tco_0091100 [Tanacetum coccineum]
MESRIQLVGFFGEVNYPLGMIYLSVTMGEQNRIQTVMMEFAVVKCHCPYNVILGRTRMRSLGAVASTIHSMIKFPTANGVATMIQASEPKEKRLEKAEPSPPPRRNVSLKEGSEGKDEPAEAHRENKPLEKVLRKNADAFLWTPTDMTGIPQFVIEHQLKTYPHIEMKVKAEVEEWLKSGIVKRVQYPRWVANPVLVKRADESWRMCIDFKELIKAYPKDLYPLPEID